ncbi:MAG TPA: sulfite exporter TauE/SafE family protein [Patescibacteria group bacterium]|nr:sulfite exporter TauE/SafE family protein [Patescibacteria group bacterium]
MKKIIVPIRGMHCHSCELILEEKLKDVRHVNRVQVSQRRGQAEIEYTEQIPSQDEIARAVSDAGYSVGIAEKQPWLSRHPEDYKRLGFAIIILLILYYFARGLGVFDLNLPSQQITVSFAIVIGLIAGISSCMAVVGGLIAGISARHAELHPEASSWQKFRPHLYFNLGRILGYAAFGGLLGILGSFLRLSSTTLALLTLLVGIVMMMLGVKLTGISPRLSEQTFALPSWIARRFGLQKHEKEYSHRGSMLSGALSFFLPCGFTQAMQVYAIGTGHFTTGAAALGLFAIGTAPALLGIGGLTSVIKGAFAKRFYAVIGLAVFIFGVVGIQNSLALTGFGVASTSGSGGQTQSLNVENENGVQIVRMTQKANGYYPNRFTIKANIPVRWIITSEADYSCAAYIYMPSQNIQQPLHAGENIIEFTPQSAGTLPFSCSMGMYRGVFNVVDNTSAGKNVITASAQTDPALNSGGSCGAGGCGCGGGARTNSPSSLTE